MKRLKRSKRMTDHDAEGRVHRRETQVRHLPGFREIVESRGGWPEDSICPEMLGAFLDVHLKGLNENSLTVIMSFCGEVGSAFLPVARRILSYSEGVKVCNHFALDLSFLNVISNSIEDHPELDEEFHRRFDDFMATNNFALSSTEVCKELVRVVAQTSVWMKGIQLLGRLKAANDVKWCDYYPLVMAAASSGNLDVVLLLHKNFLQSMDPLPTFDVIRDVKTPNMSAVWNVVLTNIIELRKTDALLARASVEKMLCHWRAVGHIPHVDVAAQLAEFFADYDGGSAAVHEQVKMSKDGRCPITGKRLERLELIKFEDLQNEFLEAVLVRENVYVNADPADLSALQKFIKDHGPFDIVIDGLNVSYHEHKRDDSPHVMIRQVLQVSTYLHSKLNMKVAVVSRDWWERPMYRGLLTKLRKVAHVFAAHQMTKDDLFSFHCCLQSGPDCYLITNDLLRDLRCMWTSELRPAFTHWQHARQININYDYVVHRLALITPRQYLTTVQEVDGTLFIPHHAVDEETQRTAHTQQDLKDAVSVDTNLRIPTTFLVIDPIAADDGPPQSFFRTHSLPDWGTV